MNVFLTSVVGFAQKRNFLTIFLLFKTSIKLCCLVHLKNVCNTLLVLAYVVVFKIGGWLQVLTKLSVISLCMTYMYYIYYVE